MRRTFPAFPFRHLATVLAILVAVPSLAAERRVPETRALLLNQQAAKCLVQKERKRAERILASLPQSSEARDAFVEMRLKDCVEAKLVFEVLTLGLNAHFSRGALAEHLLLNDFSAPGLSKGSRISPIFPMVDAERLKSLPVDQRAEIAMVAFGECVVASEPEKAFAVFGTIVGSTGEKDAIAALSPAFALCIPEGQQIELKVPDLRSFLAEGAYRVSVAKAGATPNA